MTFQWKYRKFGSQSDKIKICLIHKINSISKAVGKPAVSC